MRVHADAQVELEDAVADVRCIHVEDVAVVVHESKERNDQDGATRVHPLYDETSVRVTAAQPLVALHREWSEQCRPEKTQHGPGTRIHGVTSC